MQKENKEKYNSFFDRNEFEAFAFWTTFAGYLKHIQELSSSLLSNKYNQQLVNYYLGKINVDIDAIKTLLYKTYGLVLNIDPNQPICVDDKYADHLVDFYFWSLDYQKEIEIVVNSSFQISRKLKVELGDKNSYQRLEVITQSLHTIFWLLFNAMQMPTMILNNFDSYLTVFHNSEFGERKISGWRKDYALSQEQLLLQLKEIKSYKPWVDKCKLLYEGKIEKRELFVDITVPGIQHNKEKYKTNTWLSIFTLMSILKEYEKKHESMVQNCKEAQNSTSIFFGDYVINMKAKGSKKYIEEFKTPAAKELMKKLVDAGLLSKEWQPVNLTIAEKGYLADEIAFRLNIKAKWKVMGAIWEMDSETLRQGNIKAQNQQKTSIFIDKLKEILD